MSSIGLLQERQIGKYLRFVDVSVEGEVEAGFARAMRQLLEERPLALAAPHRVLCVGLRHEWVVGDEDLQRFNLRIRCALALGQRFSPGGELREIVWMDPAGIQQGQIVGLGQLQIALPQAVERFLSIAAEEPKNA